MNALVRLLVFLVVLLGIPVTLYDAGLDQFPRWLICDHREVFA